MGKKAIVLAAIVILIIAVLALNHFGMFYCLDVEPTQKNQCLSQIYIKQQRADLCRNLTDNFKYECLRSVACGTKNPALCDEGSMGNAEVAQSCRECIAQQP